MTTHRLVHISRTDDTASMGVFHQVEDSLERIRNRAYERFLARGGSPGASMDDWFCAEREFFDVPVSQLGETGTNYEWAVSVPGFYPDQLSVAVAPYAVTVIGYPDSAPLERKQLFSHIELETPIEIDEVKTIFWGEELLILMPKVGQAREFGFLPLQDRTSAHIS